MWELIRKNRMKSILLFALMGVCLVLLGYFIGMAVWPPMGGYLGIGAALLVWIVWSLVGYFQGDTILLRFSGAREVSHTVHPRLFNVVEEMKIAAALPALPKVYIINEDAPNAFAVGRTPEKSAVAVTTGLLECMNRDELQGVIAHEISHIQNRDVLFMTFAGMMLGSIVLISNGFLRVMWFSGGSARRIRTSGKGAGQSQIVFIVLAVFLAILAPIMAQLLYFAISRRREYLADASAVRLTRYPEGLASALEQISHNTLNLPMANKATAPMYIANPIIKKEGRALSDVTSTHPPMSERIQILRAMSKGAGLFRYQQAFNQVRGKLSGMIPESALKDAAVIPMRKGRTRPEKVRKSSKRDINDLKRAVNCFAFLVCTGCSLKLKVPPDWKKSSFPCPRCKASVRIPVMQVATAAAVLEALPGIGGGAQDGGETRAADVQPTGTKRGVYKRRTDSWETFECTCGHHINLSPIFAGRKIDCKGCGCVIAIEK